MTDHLTPADVERIRRNHTTYESVRHPAASRNMAALLADHVPALCDTIEALTRDIDEARGIVEALKDMLDAQEDIVLAYRLGKRTPEKAIDRLVGKRNVMDRLAAWLQKVTKKQEGA